MTAARPFLEREKDEGSGPGRVLSTGRVAPSHETRQSLACIRASDIEKALTNGILKSKNGQTAAARGSLIPLEPKTKHSRALLPLTSTGVRLLRAHYRRSATSAKASPSSQTSWVRKRWSPPGKMADPMADELSVTREGDMLVIRIPIRAPTPSASGKTLVVASTRGNQKAAVQIDGKDLYLGVNAYVYAEPKSR